MRILIIENVWMGGARYRLFDKLLLTTFSILPTLYARQLASITPKKHTVTVINERYTAIDFDQQYDLVNINYTTSTAPRAYEIADIFRKKGVPVVLSGLHASAVPEEAKQHADGVLLGRGEMNWLTLLHDAEQNKLQPLYQPEQYTKSTHIPPTTIELPGFVITGAIEATRGCPYQCEFCPESNNPGGSQFFSRPVDDVVAEIQSLPQRTFMFYDASLTINPKYTKELFQKMKRLHKRFFCNGNADVLARDEELVELSKKAGCASWLIGFESFSQKTINAVGKKTNNVEDYQKAVDNIHRHGMAVVGTFMFGFDTDTPDVFENTLHTMKELQIDVADFCIVTPFPGTPLFERLENEGRLFTKDWSSYTMKKVVFQPKLMTSEELLRGVRKMYHEYYSISSTIRRVARGLRLGFYPFLLILARNMVATMNSRSLFTSTEKR